MRDPKSRGWLRAALLLSVVSVPLGCLCARAARAEEQSSRSVVPEQTTPPRNQLPGPDSRAKKLAKLLDLTEAQQAKLAKVLASQHEQIRKLWSDQRVPSEYRVSEMRAINDKTEDQIRALLNDEQKKKYIASHAQEASRPAQESNLDYWLNATKPK